MPGPPQLRVSDQERERVAEEIRQHYAIGRLTEEELTERVHASYAARTVGDLDALRHDLPPLEVAPTQEQLERSERKQLLRRQLLQRTGSMFIPFLVCVVIWIAAGATGNFWPIWVAIPGVIALLVNGWPVYGPAPELHAERRRERGERRDARRQRRLERRGR